MYKLASSVAFLFLLATNTSIAQDQLTKEEIASFYSLIQQTKEYKQVMRRVDSINNANTNNVPEEVKMGIVKRDRNAPEFIFYAYIERRLAIGPAMDRYVFQYDKRKKQIVSVARQKSRFEIE